MPLGQYMGLSISLSSIFVLFLSFLHKERNPVKAGGFQAASFFFTMQATVDMIDTTNLMQPIKKDGHSQKGLSLNKVSSRTSPINSIVILLVCVLSLKINSIYTNEQPTVLFNELFANFSFW